MGRFARFRGINTGGKSAKQAVLVMRKSRETKRRGKAKKGSEKKQPAESEREGTTPPEAGDTKKT